MALKEGYKLTEIGEIPVDWDLVQLKSLVDETRSIRYGIVQPGKYDPLGRLMIRGQDYSKGWVHETQIFRVGSQIEERYKNARLKYGDLIITIVGAGTGHVEIIPPWLDGANLTQTTARIAIDNKKVSGNFCKHVLQSHLGKNQVANFIKGGAQPGLNCADVEKFLIPLPKNLKEQYSIALTLSEIDDQIAALDALIAKKRDIKQGVMQRLLTGEERLAGFSGEWEVRQLGEVSRVKRGASPRPIDDVKWFGGDIGWVRISDVTSSDVYLTQTKDYLSNLGVERSVRIYPNELIMSIAATVGLLAISKIEACIHDGFIVFKDLDRNINTLFLYYYLTYFSKIFTDAGQTGSQKNVNSEIVKQAKLPLPPYLEQEAIAFTLSDIDAEIIALGEKRRKTVALKQGMMQELLTGKTRLI